VTAYGATKQLFSTPYLTPMEFRNAPTSVNSTALVPGGTSAQQDAELTNLIARASSEIDTFCRQVLAATTDTEQMTGRIGRDGMMRLHPRYTPVRSVSALSYGASPDAMSTVTIDSTVWVADNRIVVPASLIGAASPTGPFPRPSIGGRTVLVQVTYVNGYPNTTLTADVTAATALAVKDATGILPGDTLNVYDETNGIQTVTVAGSWTPTTGAASVAVTEAVTSLAGTAVSGLPPAVKQACIHVVTALLKGRGATSLTMAVATSPGSAAKKPSGGSDGSSGWDMAQAKSLLLPFRRVR
jgi:hypothetical protein